MEKINGFWADKNGNKWDAGLFNEKQAEKLSLTLKNCKHCENCYKCEDCQNCKRCENCKSCENCNFCVKCKNCYRCNGINEVIS